MDKEVIWKSSDKLLNYALLDGTVLFISVNPDAARTTGVPGPGRRTCLPPPLVGADFQLTISYYKSCLPVERDPHRIRGYRRAVPTHAKGQQLAQT